MAASDAQHSPEIVPWDEVSWEALCDAVDAARLGDSAECWRLTTALYKEPVDTVLTYLYLRTLLMFLVGEAAGFDVRKRREAAARLADRYREAWPLITHIGVEHFDYALLIAGRAGHELTRAEREPKIEHYVSAAGLVLRESGKLPDAYRSVIKDVHAKNPLHPEMVEKRRAVFDDREAKAAEGLARRPIRGLLRRWQRSRADRF